MKNYIKRSTLILITFAFVGTANSANLDKLKVAPKLPNKLSDGGLKKLENEPGFEPPKPIRRGPPRYPRRQAKKSQGGMVDIAFVVDETGEIQEPIVLDSTHADFESSALAAVKRYEYEPASFDGKPLKSATSIRIRFEMMHSEDAAGRAFYKAYKRADKELNSKKPDKQKIRHELDRMADADFLSSYSLAYMYLMEFRFASEFLTKREQLHSLRKLLLFENHIGVKKQFLDKETTKSLRMNILQLLIQLGYYGEARGNYYWLKKDFPSGAKLFSKAMKQVYKALNSGSSIVRPIEIHDRGYEYIDLAKLSFEIAEVDGKIEKFNFYCTRNFGTMDYIPDSNYEVPKSWGACEIQVIGTPGTTAKLYQH